MNLTQAQSRRMSGAMADTMRRIREQGSTGGQKADLPVSVSMMNKAIAAKTQQTGCEQYVTLSDAQQRQMSMALAECLAGLRVLSENPDIVAQFTNARIADRYVNFPDGAEAGSGRVIGGSYTPDYYQARQRMLSAPIIDADFTVVEYAKTVTSEDLHAEQKLLNHDERRSATKQTVDQSIPKQDMSDATFWDRVRQMIDGRFRETEAQQQAKQAAANSTRTDPERIDRQVAYAKDACTSQGQSFSYNVVYEKVDWGAYIKDKSGSVVESVEKLVSFITNAVNKNYGGWGRITEIIVRDQHLIINRTCFRPVLDPSTIESGAFPIDSVDYLKDGALASFFDWGMLRHMRNLHVIDIDDMSFYEYCIGDRLKCGRRIGVSTLFNLCKSLDVLILAGDEVTRDSLYTKQSTPVKQKLATHKRFSLFSDGYKIEVCKNTNDFASWTFGNMKNYACNRGDRGLFKYCCGVTARAGLAGVAGVLNLGTHLVGGIRDIFKEAMKPIDPSDVGLQ